MITTTTTTTTTTNNNNNVYSTCYRPLTAPFQTKLNSTSTNEIGKLIQFLKSKYASGYDGISTKLLKVSSAIISSTLNHVSNKSLSSGTFPDHLNVFSNKLII
jgi:hypothetical protein